MEIVPFIVTYNGMATGPCIKRCVEYLTAEGPTSFGTAIERIDIYPRCQTRNPIDHGLKFMMDRFQAGLATLPFVRFRRKARLFEVSYASEWVHSSAIFGASTFELPPSKFKCLCREFAAALFVGTSPREEVGRLRRRCVRDTLASSCRELEIRSPRRVLPANQPLHLTAAASRLFEVQRLTSRRGR